MSLALQNPLIAVMPPGEVRRIRYALENQALHLGTYEAAIESMLRRMREQDDAGANFFLYRTALHRHGLKFERNWRDENSENAAQITQADLGVADVVRYLNVFESPGSISLAIRPRAIASIQRISLPVIEMTPTISLLREIADIRARITDIETMRSARLSRLNEHRRQFASGRHMTFARAPNPEQRVLLGQIEKLIIDEYLSDISLPVRAAFSSALDAWKSEYATSSDAVYVSQFASMARILTHPEEIIQEISNQPVENLRI